MGKKKAVLEGEGTAGAVEKGKGKAAVAEAGTPGGVEKKEKEPVACIHEHADLVLRREFPEICDKLADEAKKGNIPALKVLLELAKTAGAKAEQQDGKSLGEMLMDELKRRQDEREAAADAAKPFSQIQGFIEQPGGAAFLPPHRRRPVGGDPGLDEKAASGGVPTHRPFVKTVKMVEQIAKDAGGNDASNEGAKSGGEAE